MLEKSEIKQEYIEEDHLEIVDDLNQVAHCFSSNQHVKIENVEYNCEKQENFVDVSISNGSTNIKQELEEEDPLGLADDSKQEGRYNCDKCEKSFTRKSDLTRHIQSVHDKIRYNCNQCNKSFSEKGTLQKHIKSAHEKVRYNCKKCDKSFSRKTYLKAHIQAEHENVRYNCDKCEKSFSQKTDLNRHIKSVHENVRYNCDKCDKRFSQKGKLNRHIESVHENFQYNSNGSTNIKLEVEDEDPFLYVDGLKQEVLDTETSEDISCKHTKLRWPRLDRH